MRRPFPCFRIESAAPRSLITSTGCPLRSSIQDRRARSSSSSRNPVRRSHAFTAHSSGCVSRSPSERLTNFVHTSASHGTNPVSGAGSGAISRNARKSGMAKWRNSSWHARAENSPFTFLKTAFGPPLQSRCALRFSSSTRSTPCAAHCSRCTVARVSTSASRADSGLVGAITAASRNKAGRYAPHVFGFHSSGPGR